MTTTGRTVCRETADNRRKRSDAKETTIRVTAGGTRGDTTAPTATDEVKKETEAKVARFMAHRAPSPCSYEWDAGEDRRWRQKRVY